MRMCKKERGWSQNIDQDFLKPERSLNKTTLRLITKRGLIYHLLMLIILFDKNAQ